jgi:3-dehydroquinate dehydratase-2
MNILIINGPNLNLTGLRETAIYGHVSFDVFIQSLQQQFPQHQIGYFQSNHEGALIDKLHDAGFTADGILLNAGAYSHTSYALADAVEAIATPVIEVHMSNIAAREAFRHTSVLSAHCIGTITGFGLQSYSLALLHFISNSQG